MRRNSGGAIVDACLCKEREPTYSRNDHLDQQLYHDMVHSWIFTIAALFATVAQAQVAVWGTCGGVGYTGPTTCDAGHVCVQYSIYYSQCVPGSNVPPSSSPSTFSTTAPTTAPPPPPSSGNKIYFGTATDRPSSYGTIVPDNFNLLVSENGMKWDAHERSRGVFDFSASLSQIAYAKQRGMKMRGHCLVWHNQMPSFYCSNQAGGTTGCAGSSLNSQQLLQVIETRIQKTFAALNDPTIIAWDVLNEAVADDGSGLKRDVFYNTLGPDYVTQIFTLARKFAPAGVKLFYNDYGCDTPGVKASQCFKLVSDVKAKGLVDGMGFEMRLSPSQNLSGQVDLFKRFSDSGVMIHVTEMDVGGANQEQQINVFRTVCTNCADNPNGEALVVWGVSDKDSWRTGENPLLFDNNLQKKPQYTICHDILAKGHPTRVSN
ncbi:hypothetical protein AC1031_015101 [Aphanomyces cochlioides]|nr:hypothetical protein AC1031_015101 [Aphanomyces cochlioides]